MTTRITAGTTASSDAPVTARTAVERSADASTTSDARRSTPAAAPIQRPADAIDPRSLRRVLVVMLRHHGDVLLTSPLYTALHRAAPQVEIDALVYRETLPMIECNASLTKVHSIDRSWKEAGVVAHVRAEWRLLSALRERGYDLVVHLTDHRRGAWLVRALRPRYAVAPRRRDENDPRGLASRFWQRSFTHRYANASSVGPGAALARRHTVDQNLDALRRLGIDVSPPPRLAMVPGDAGERDADALLSRLGVDGDFIAMQPTSRWSFKCWPVDRNAALIASLLRRGETIVLSCAPEERERATIAAIVAAVRAMHAVPLARLKVADDGGTLNRLAALIGRAKLFVGIDSAPMHIAAAMQTPVVALFGPSGEFNWGPWQVAHRVVVQRDFACRPCGQDGCGNGKVSDCLVTLPVVDVLDAIDSLQGEVSAAGDPLRFA